MWVPYSGTKWTREVNCIDAQRETEREMKLGKKKNPKCGNLAATGRDRNRSESLGVKKKKMEVKIRVDNSM